MADLFVVIAQIRSLGIETLVMKIGVDVSAFKD